MSFKELLHLNKLKQKIKLDASENEFIIFSDEENIEEPDINLKKYSNEWNHEYELIYNSYVLEK